MEDYEIIHYILLFTITCGVKGSQVSSVICRLTMRRSKIPWGGLQFAGCSFQRDKSKKRTGIP